MGVNDNAWESLFEKYHIVEEISRNGAFGISASQIKEFREPRLMTKFDHKVNLPKIFVEHGLAILPITRGDYIISPFAAYHEFEEPSGMVQAVSIPPSLQSLMPQFLVSEAIALNCAYACGILHDFLGEEKLVPTVSGRMGSGDFAFDISTSLGPKHIIVHNSQIEIDAAYEGAHSLAVLEAKMDLSDDFLIRQLYYPFRVWNNRVAKPVKPVFLTFSNGVFSLYEYQFEVPGNYNSLRLVKQKNYVIETKIDLSDIESLLSSVRVVPEPNLPFPQANNMERIINLVELLHKKPMTKDDITSEYAFDRRQTQYYTDAGRYLGLIEKSKDDRKYKFFQLSALGQQIMGLPYQDRQLAIITQILKHRAFAETLKFCLQYGKIPDASRIVQIMKAAELYHVQAESTYYRRSSTIISWMNWILKLMKAPERKGRFSV